ncbi:MAG: hypothetical protein ACRDJC_09660, partial [Thermomicrobiales bacterium]
ATPSAAQESDEGTRFVRKLWFITAAMVTFGIALILGSLATGAGPIFLVGGVLLVWSAIVKVIVLRVWSQTLGSPPPQPEPRRVGASGASIGQMT